jgi:hypothetical protein
MYNGQTEELNFVENPYKIFMRFTALSTLDATKKVNLPVEFFHEKVFFKKTSERETVFI